MKNVKQVTEQLADVFEKLKSGTIECKAADALANVAGKLIKVNLGQLQYYDQRKETPVLDFWAQDSPK